MRKLLACLDLILILLFSAPATFAQMYTVTDLGVSGTAVAINDTGQVVVNSPSGHAFRTAPNSAVNSATDDLGTLGGLSTSAAAINSSGQVVGWSYTSTGDKRAFRTAANRLINSATDNLGVLCCSGSPMSWSWATAINDSGQVVGMSLDYYYMDGARGFRTAPNSPINPSTDDLGILVGGNAAAINASGQVVGYDASPTTGWHIFRTAPNSAINAATDYLGGFGGFLGNEARAINELGQVVGYSTLADNQTRHAFRTAPNNQIDPAADDLGTIGGTNSDATDINAYSQVVGSADKSDGTTHAFLHDGGTMHDLNDLIRSDSGWVLLNATAINNAGQIIGNGLNNGDNRPFVLNPIYKAVVQQPIRADGRSIFPANRGTIPVKFTLTQYAISTCTLPAGTISLSRTAGATSSVPFSRTSVMSSYNGSYFRIDHTACQYVYNLPALDLGVGQYRVDISINGIIIGHAVFALD